jgi:NTP pyrophosphatase (non-canonical NTP hydrolase)
MTSDEYQEAAARTMNSGFSKAMQVANYCLGLAGETGETVDYIKKTLFHGHAMDHDKLKKELGDCLWYVAAVATLYGLKLSDIQEANIAKLKARYPEGFSTTASRLRVENSAAVEQPQTLPPQPELPPVARQPE